MPESPTSRGRAATTQRGVASSREGARSSPAAPQLQVRYYNRMRINRVYPLVVGWAKSGKEQGGSGNPVLVRLVMAGAQVVPAEQSLDPGDPDATATFYVTPLAKGWLRGERLEVIQGGRKVQEMRLPAKVTSQRKTWLFLALLFLVPLYVTPIFTREGRFAELAEPRHGADEDVPRAVLSPGKSLEAKLNKIAPEVPGWLKESVFIIRKPSWDALQAESVLAGVPGAVREQLFKDLHKLTQDKNVDKDFGTSTAFVAEFTRVLDRPEYRAAVSKGERDRLKDEVLKQAVTGKPYAFLRPLQDIPEYIGLFYNYLYFKLQDVPLGFYAFSLLLVLTVLSWWWHLESRKRRVGKPLPVGGGIDED